MYTLISIYVPPSTPVRRWREGDKTLNYVKIALDYPNKMSKSAFKSYDPRGWGSYGAQCTTVVLPSGISVSVAGHSYRIV